MQWATQPEHREVHALLAEVLARLGRTGAAAVVRKRAEAMSNIYQIDDEARGEVSATGVSAGFLAARAHAIARERNDEAMGLIREALAARPNDPELLSTLAQVHLAVGRLDPGLDALREVLRRSPGHQAAREMLREVLADVAFRIATDPDPRARNGRQALQLAQELVRVEGSRSAAVLSVLAAAMAANGSFADATRTLQEAMRGGDAAFRASMAPRLERYRRGQVWHR